MTGVAHEQLPSDPQVAGWSDAVRVGRDERAEQRHPVRRAASVVAVAYLVLTGVMLTIGFLLTDVLDRSVGRWDEHVNETFVHDRAGTWNAITKVATSAMNTLPVVVVVVLLVGAFAWRRKWQEAGIVAIAITLEITVFLSTTFTVGRPRPAVPRLNATPSTSSFPSGHTAAATVLCVAVALIVSRHAHGTSARIAAWTIAAVFITAVGVARVYRGLHHPTDVAAGVLLGVACVAAAVVTVRAASTEATDRAP